MMRIIIAGSRSATKSQVREALNRCRWSGFTSAVVSGTARGADSFGEEWAEENDLEVLQFPAEWKKYGKRAGPMRNKQMAENAEGLIAVWDGQSRGTRSMLDSAKKRGLRIALLRTDTDVCEEIPPSGALAEAWEAVEERAALKEYGGQMSRSRAEREAGREFLHSL